MSKIKNILITILAAGALFPACLEAQTPLEQAAPFTEGLGGATLYMTATPGAWQNDEWNYENNIARDADGNVYLAGTYYPTGSSDPQVFVRKLTPNGVELWTSTVTTPGAAYGRGVTLDGAGNLYVLARVGNDIGVAKYAAATGLELWAQPTLYNNIDNPDSDNAYDIAADDTGAYVAGTVNSKIALLKFPVDGAAPTVARYEDGNSYYTAAYGVAISSLSNSVALAGSIYDETYGTEIWVAKYNKATLAHVWASTYTSSNHPQWGYDEARAVKMDDNDNIYAAGYYYSYDSGNDIWLGKYDSSGNLTFSATKNGPSNGYDKAMGLALDSFGNIYVTGKMEAYSLNQGDNLWIGKYAPAGGEPSEVSIHKNFETGYDVQASTSDVVVGGGFEFNYGVVKVAQEQFGEAQQLFAGPGWYTGAVNLFWMFDVAGSYDYRIQYSTYEAAAWDENAAGNISGNTGGNVFAGQTWNQPVPDLHVRMNHAYGANEVGPVYYFKVWLSNDAGSTWTPLSNVASAVPNAPYNYWSDSMRGQDRIWVFNNSRAPYSAMVRDGAGNTYLGYQASYGGGAITKLDSNGMALWTAYNNSAEGSGSTTFIKMRLDSDGNIYAAGAADPLGGGMPDAWIAKFNPMGVRLWEESVSGLAEGLDYFMDIALDGAGSLYAGGGVSTADGGDMLLVKYSTAGAMLSSTTYRGGAAFGKPAEIGALAIGPDANIYVGGQISQISGSATDRDAAIIKFAPNLSQISGTAYANPSSADVESKDMILAMAFNGADLYVAGSRNMDAASPLQSVWLAKGQPTTFEQLWVSTYNSVDNRDAEAAGMQISGGYLYISGYENRNSVNMPGEYQKNLFVRKYTLGGLEQWGKSIDGAWQNESARAFGMEVGSDGYFYLSGLFNVWPGGFGDEGNPGLARIAEPQTGLMAEPGFKPGSVRLAWIPDAELPTGTTFYVHYSTAEAALWSFDAAAAQYSFFTENMLFSGDYMNRLVPGLETGNGAMGAIESPRYYFRIAYSTPTAYPGETPGLVVVNASTNAVANTPGVWDRMDRYPNGNLFIINNVHGGKNPLVRDAAGNIYTAGSFNPWGNIYTAYVRKFNRDGQHVWTRYYSDQYENSMPVINALALDTAGNLYAAGTAGSDSWTNYYPYTMESQTKRDGFMVKYALADGRMQWAKTYDYQSPAGISGNDAFLGIAVSDVNNTVYGAGYINSVANGREAFVAKISRDTGVVLSSVATGELDSVFNDVEVDEAGNVFAVGSSSNGATGADTRIIKAGGNDLSQIATLPLSEAGENEAYALAIDTSTAGTPVLYVAGEKSVNGQQDAVLHKFTAAGAAITPAGGLFPVTYNSANENEDEAVGVALDGLSGVYISGVESRYDINQGKNLFIRKYNTSGELIWTQNLNSAGNNEDSAGGIAVDAVSRSVYAAVDAGQMGAVAGVYTVPGTYSTGSTANSATTVNGAGYFQHIQFNMNVVNPRLTVRVNDGPNSSVSGVRVAVMGFSSTGGIDPNGIRTDVTASSGAWTFSLPAGKAYFVAVSSHNMVPTIKDQLSDPGANFFVELNADVTKQYYISNRAAAADPVHKMYIALSNLTADDYVMGEVFINQTGERVGYSVIRAAGATDTMEIYNLPEAANGVYGMAVSVPARNKVLQLFMSGPFPSTNTYTADMNNATQLTGSFEVGNSTVPPSVGGIVMDANWSPLEGARVKIERQGCTSWDTNPEPDICTSWQPVFSKETLTDAGGSYSFYSVPYVPCPGDIFDWGGRCSTPEVNYNLSIGKSGYESGNRSFFLQAPLPDMAPIPQMDQFNLALATYTLSGILKYNNVPLPNALIMVNGDWNRYEASNDSYRQCEYNGCGVRSDARVRTGADGSFTVTGLTDGNARLEAAFEGGWRSLNEGNDSETMSDNLRVVISSQGARGPVSPPNNGCRSGRTWVLDSSGTCKGFNTVAFNIVPQGANTLGRLYGSLTFITTYTVTGSNPLIISTSSPLTLMAQERCDGDCKQQQMGFTSLAGTFITNTTSYAIVLSSGISYYPRVFSTDWAKASSFESEIDLRSTDTFRQDMSVLRAGGLRGVVKLPDGTNFQPIYGNIDSTTTYMADISIDGLNVDVSDGRNVDDSGEFEFPNLAPGNYKITMRPRGRGFVWAPATVESVAVTEGRTTEVKLQLEAGLAVQPQIYGLPAISTPSWGYFIVGVESGEEMTQKKVTDLFFSDPKYSFNYSTTTGWSTMYMPPGQYDFYLILGAEYNPGGGDYDIPSFSQFANFIGRVRGMAVQKSETNPNVGTAAQPIAINILGAIGQGHITGTVQGRNIFTDPDFDRFFANFDEMFGLIPAMMLYDSAGDLRGFANAMPSEDDFQDFETAMMLKDREAMRAYMVSKPMIYGVWGVPPGRYTAVFNNPNYPPVAKEITLPANASYLFDFDDEEMLPSGITGVVRSSVAPNAPLEGARVYLKHRTVEKFTLTTSTGYFSFSNLPTGIYRLEVNRNGYVTAGEKTSLAADDSKAFTMYMLPSESKITGRVFMSKFPTQVTKAGVDIVAYDETHNVNYPESYLPKTETQTDASGNFEINGVVPGHLYKLSAFYTGKLAELLEVTAEEGNTVMSDITLKDIPPQITIKVKKSADSASKVDVVIKSPKQLISAPSCSYNPGETFAADSAVTLALVPGPNKTYLGQFTISSSQQYYTVRVTAGDAGNKMVKEFVYDQVSNAKTEQYIQQESMAGGSVQMDKESEEYSGIELDPGALSYSTVTAAAVDYTNLVGGFFSALPSVRTVKTAKGNLTISDAVKDLMASEVYNMDLSNASANKPFTLTLKYDKERGAGSRNLRIYQQDADNNWQEVPGNYTVDPMLGVLSVDVAGLTNAYAGTSAVRTPLGRKRAGMSSVVNGRYRPSAVGTQSGRFAVLTAPPIAGVPYSGSDFDVYNMPNPFDLKTKTVTLSGDAGASAGAYTTVGTVIKYHLPADKAGSLKFVIYNLAGEKVRTFNMGSSDPGKVHYFEWDGRNETNQNCASGVYFLMTFLDGKQMGSKAHKMAIIK